MDIGNILSQASFDKTDIVALLEAEGEDKKALFAQAAKVKEQTLGNIVYFRGLVEFMNYCRKDCLYCGIRKGNEHQERYQLSDDEIIDAAKYTADQGYGSLVLQGGELLSDEYAKRITNLLDRIHQQTNNKLHITLSLGEQAADTYRTWFEHGAHRYLLRIETSNAELYRKIHPDNEIHAFKERLRCLTDLQSIGYQTGTGVMIGLPFQTLEHLADDLLFMQQFGIDMVGMGPYIEHKQTPLYDFRDTLWPIETRFLVSLKMISVLRLMMPEINIAAATALQAIDKVGREKALKVGANVMMPNVTPGMYRDNYKLYENKPCTDEDADQCAGCIEARVAMAGHEIAYNQWGDSKYYRNRMGL